MAYYNGNVAKGEYTKAICDPCAQGPGYPRAPNGAVPFYFDSLGIPCQESPWRWAGWDAGPSVICAVCGRPVDEMRGQDGH